nr:hypothetical protein CFP56_66010 [Quercus suber]
MMALLIRVRGNLLEEVLVAIVLMRNKFGCRSHLQVLRILKFGVWHSTTFQKDDFMVLPIVGPIMLVEISYGTGT